MTLTRRQTLAILGGGAVVAATASAGTFLTTRTPEKALAPWNAAGTYEDPRLYALSHALLAPNPHNRQPWLLELIGEDRFVLHRDETRELPHTDPFQRQIFIGLGCFLELMSIAATQKDRTAEIALFPEGEEGPVAHVNLQPGSEAEPLSAQVLSRRSCKEPFQDKPVPGSAVAALEAHGNVVTDAGQVARIRDLTWDAWLTETQTPRTLKESVDLMRFGKSEINANPDGIDLGGPFLETLMLAGVLNRKDQLDPDSTGFQEGVKLYREMLAATPAYVVLTSRTNTRADQIDAGRRWLRLNLETTRLGLALHPVSQALQEFPEMSDLYSSIHGRLAQSGETIQMLARIGHGSPAVATPRWELETRVIDG